MENLDPTQNRLTELEIKLSYTEHQLEQLDAVVVRQQQQIDALIAELRHLREAGTSETQPGQRSLRDELPPHY
jgi:SlyX protein